MSENSTPSVIELKPNKLIDLLDTLTTMAKEGELDNIIIAGLNSDKEVITARCNVNLVDQQQLVSFLQVDTTVRILKETYQDVRTK